MSDFLNIADFLSPISKAELSFDQGYKEGTIGSNIKVHDEENFPDMDEADLVFIGCGEQRGNGHHLAYSAGPDAIRRQFYHLFFWHQDIRMADLGNLRKGAGLSDTYAALRTVVNELISEKKTVIILGGSHDLTLAQYYAYEQNKSIIEVTNVDALIDLNLDSDFRCDNFLMEMLTGEPNYVRHYNHIGFQSYYVHPRMLETMDKLRFDCFRVGHVKENIDEMEPVIRNSQLFSFDISALAYAYAPANTTGSPNGFNGKKVVC
jgi:arginase family enzyme